MPPIPVFPTLPVGFPVKWRPTWKTTVGMATSGREVRASNQTYPLHEFELQFGVLRDQTQNRVPYAPLSTYTDFMYLCQFWLMMYGKFGLFHFDAPWDDSRDGQVIGTGDGVTANFTLYRTFGIADPEPVGAAKTISAVYLNGTPRAPGTYSASGNVLTFNSPVPALGVVVSADFSFYYLCHFVEDKQDFDEFFKNIWQVKSLKFRSTHHPV